MEFDCSFGDIPVVSPMEKSVGLTSLVGMHRKVTGQSPDNSSHSRAKKIGILDRSSLTESDRSLAGKQGGV